MSGWERPTHRPRNAAAIINSDHESSAGVIDTKMIDPMEVQISTPRGFVYRDIGATQREVAAASEDNTVMGTPILVADMPMDDSQTG